MEWVQKLKWSNLTRYNSAKRKALINPADNQTEGFVKAYGKFKFYTILGAGHAVSLLFLSSSVSVSQSVSLKFSLIVSHSENETLNQPYRQLERVRQSSQRTEPSVIRTARQSIRQSKTS